MKVINLRKISNIIVKRKVIFISSTVILVLCIVIAAAVKLTPHQSTPVHQPPQLTVSEPKAINTQTLVVTGKSDPGDSVFVDGVKISPKADGSFELTLTGSQTASRIMRIVAANQWYETVSDVDIIPPLQLLDDEGKLDTPKTVKQPQQAQGSASTQPINTLVAKQTTKVNSSAASSDPSSAALVYKGAPIIDINLNGPASTHGTTFVIHGKTTPPRVKVVIGIQTFQSDLDGRFSAIIPLKKGTNTTKITAITPAGKRTTKIVTITSN